MNKIFQIINKKCSLAYVFKPKKEFYKEIGVPQKRFGQLMRNEKEALNSELERIAKFFNVEVSDLIEKK